MQIKCNTIQKDGRAETANAGSTHKVKLAVTTQHDSLAITWRQQVNTC